MSFDELISNGQLTKAARLFAKEYYDSLKIDAVHRLLIERLADKCDKYDAAITRQSATTNEVQEAIVILTEWRDFLSGTLPADAEGTREIMSYNLAITALQAYQLPSAIKWTGDNLREVINLIGWNESASSKWTWEEYEQVVKEKGLKIFTPDGPVVTEVGSWIVRDGKDCHALQAYQPKVSCTIEFDDLEYFVGECSNCGEEIDPDYGWSYCPGCGRRIGGLNET